MTWLTVLMACAGNPVPTTPTPAEAPEPTLAPADPPAEVTPADVDPDALVDPDAAPPTDVADATPDAVEAPTEGALAADGATCLAPTDCASGVCEGEGCSDDAPGVCMSATMRACSRDLRPYCDCEGNTFRTSGSCPGKRFAHRGACGSL